MDIDIDFSSISGWGWAGSGIDYSPASHDFCNLKRVTLFVKGDVAGNFNMKLKTGVAEAPVFVANINEVALTSSWQTYEVNILTDNLADLNEWEQNGNSIEVINFLTSCDNTHYGDCDATDYYGDIYIDEITFIE